MTLPCVSVVLPTHNRAHLLSRAIDSVISQTMQDWELIVVDDGSTDDTQKTVEGYRDRLGSRLVYHDQDNAGPGAARNLGIDRARGRFVAFLDSDDEFMPTKLARQVELFEKEPSLGLVYCDSAFVDLDGRRHESVFQDKTRLACAVPFDEIEPGLRVCRGSLFDWLIKEYFVSTICGMVRREVLTREIRFPVAQSYAEEWLFYLKVSRAVSAGYVNEPLCLHHFTAGSLARTDRQSNQIELRRLLLRIRDTFADLNREQKRALQGNLASCNRQLGYDTYRFRLYRSAARYFLESFRARPKWRTLGEAAQATFHSLIPSIRG